MLNEARFNGLPPLLRKELEPVWRNYQINATAKCMKHLSENPQVSETLPEIWALSPFIAQQCAQDPDFLDELVCSGDLSRQYAEDGFSNHCNHALAGHETEEDFNRALRLLRRREMVRIAWRDLAGWADLNENLRDLSAFADSVLQQTLLYHYKQLVQRFGKPCNGQGEEQQMVILALGKLGGGELNFSSDIDLIFCYPEAGETQGERRVLSNQEFFVRLGQKLIQSLHNITAEGFVFRVDMRLRPFGKSGPLAMNFAAMEDYYQAHAREWERYALLKARQVTGGKAGQELQKALRPFVFRRYLDFGAFEALRELKDKIDRETQIKGYKDNLKLGKGGIREIEFICQTFQLIRGGREPALQTRHLLQTVERLKKFGLLPADVLERLRIAYCFLRRSEHRLQAIGDKQTQLLPRDEVNRLRLAWGMGFSDWNSFMGALDEHRIYVADCFHDIFSGESGRNENKAPVQTIAAAWGSAGDIIGNTKIFAAAGFECPEEAAGQLQKLHDAYALRGLSQRGRDRLDRLMPLLLTAVSEHPSRDTALLRLFSLVEAVAKRSVYLSLLIAYPKALGQLVHFCGDSAWIAEQITQYPILLDELLDPRRLYDPLDAEQLDQALLGRLEYLPPQDLEAHLDALRQFKRSQVLRVAAAELNQKLGVEIASDYLSAVADCCLRQALSLAWRDLTDKYGEPQCQTEQGLRTAQLCIVAYGKAGGLEMSYSSDLDLVFLHDSEGNLQMTNGQRSIDNHVFFSRLVTRIVHLLTTPTSGGILYEVDQRLRPGGKSGLLVSSFAAFYEYQDKHAWTWEHQALLRARAIAGSDTCMAQFEQIRRVILNRQRETGQLCNDVVEMRQRMRDTLDKSSAQSFDLKQGIGGIADIEFVVQYKVLQNAAKYPGLLDTTGMLPMLRLLAGAMLLGRDDVEQLSEAYRCFRTETHRLALQNKAALVPAEDFKMQRENVKSIWQEIFSSARSADIP